MTRLLTNDSLATYATVNLNRVSRGDNGSDHTVFLRYSPVSRPATPITPAPDAGRPATDALVEEGYSSAAGLGLVLVVATVIGAAAIGALVLRSVLALLG